MTSNPDSVLDERAKKTFSHLRYALLPSSMSEKNIKKKQKRLKFLMKHSTNLVVGLNMHMHAV